MRKITRLALDAFMAREPFALDNTQVKIDPVVGGIEVELYLFGNLIAKRFANDQLWVTHAGWPRNTTKERLNALPGVSIQQVKGDWYMNGDLWDGRWTEVLDDGEWRYVE